MKTQKRTFLGIDITRHKPLYDEIDALTEENREQAAEIGKLHEKIDEQEYTIKAQNNRIGESYKANASLADKLVRIKAKATEFEEKYNAAVKYQHNTQAAYDELKADYDRFLAHTKWGCTEGESKDKVAEKNAVPTGCETAKTIGVKTAQPRDKGGRFEKKHKRADDPRK